MRKLERFWKIIVFDTLGVIFMIIAVLTGWLPGPGGIPLFIIGLSLLAVNHEWARRYMDILKKYADKIGDLIFIKNRVVQLVYDILAPFLVLFGTVLITMHDDWWVISLGIFGVFLGLTIFLGNRGRWHYLKSKFKPRS